MGYKESDIGKQAEGMQSFTMEQTISKLEEANERMGGILFSTFGKGKHKALMFPLPKISQTNIGDSRTRQAGEITVSEYLVVTKYGFKLIRVDGDDERTGIPDIYTLVKNRQGKKSLFGFGGYRNDDGGTLDLGPIKITPRSAYYEYLGPLHGRDDLWGTLQSTYRKNFYNCRLVEPSGSEVEQILNVNKERVDKIRASTQIVHKLA